MTDARPRLDLAREQARRGFQAQLDDLLDIESGLDEKPVALVTGATRGIGLAIARELGRTHRVLVGGRERAACETVCRELPDAKPFVADLADADAVAQAAAGVLKLDVLVHSAGVIGAYERVDALTRDDFRRTFELNVIAVADLTRLVLPRLRARKGLVVAINSGSGYTSGTRGAVYSGSKFALRALTDALREEEREHGVRVSSIHPGRVATDMQRELRAAEGGEYREEDYLRPEAVAEAVRLAVDTPRGGSVDELRIRPLG